MPDHFEATRATLLHKDKQLGQNRSQLSERQFKERFRNNFRGSLAPVGREQGEGVRNTVVIFEPFPRRMETGGVEQ